MSSSGSLSGSFSGGGTFTITGLVNGSGTVSLSGSLSGTLMSHNGVVGGSLSGIIGLEPHGQH